MLFAWHERVTLRNIMDDDALLTACSETLMRALGGGPKARRRFARADSGADAVFSIRLPELGAVTLVVVIKRGLRPSSVPLITQQTGRLVASGQRVLLCTDYVSPRVGERLRGLGIWYADAAGNAYIREPGALYVYSDGRRLPPLPPPRGQTYSEAGARAVFFLVRNGPKVTATYRDIQATTAVSLDKISKVFGELEARRVIAVQGRGRYEVVAPDRLLDLWVDGFADRLAPALELARCRAAEGDDLAGLLRREAPALDKVTVAGEVAADLVTGHLRTHAARLYLAPEDEARVQRTLRLAPAQDGPIVLCRAFASDLADEGIATDGLRVAHAALVYAELMATDDARLGEAALRLRKERLAWTL